MRLVMALTGRARGEVLAGVELNAEQGTRLEELVARRLAGEPLQYLEGTVQFGPIELATDPRALIPRPETEQLWGQAVAALGTGGPGTVIVDLGTGSGALALALKHRFPRARVIGTDISEEALELASENARRLALDVELRPGDLFEALPGEVQGRVDLLVANPPYVAEAAWDALPVDVRHEPLRALVAGPTGTEAVDRIADGAYWWLAVGGWLLCEIGEGQGRHALEVFGAWFDTDLRQDLTGRDRILVARKGARCCG
ncbi:MAG: peptide chain release factor N(5)-glutamine methyltransferase [Acidimicrobiia bacterium]